MMYSIPQMLYELHKNKEQFQQDLFRKIKLKLPDIEFATIKKQTSQETETFLEHKELVNNKDILFVEGKLEQKQLRDVFKAPLKINYKLLHPEEFKDFQGQKQNKEILSEKLELTEQEQKEYEKLLKIKEKYSKIFKESQELQQSQAQKQNKETLLHESKIFTKLKLKNSEQSKYNKSFLKNDPKNKKDDMKISKDLLLQSENYNNNQKNSNQSLRNSSNSDNHNLNV